MNPECYGVFRSPQSDAENDCVACFLDRKCMYRFAFNAGLERAAALASAMDAAWKRDGGAQDAMPSPGVIAATIRAEKEADHG